jgi:hypothetical protein
LRNERPTEWTPQRKNIDNGSVDLYGKYVLRLRLSWTALYGKEPWPRERKLWEKDLNKPGISRYGMLYKSHVEIKVKCSKT